MSRMKIVAGWALVLGVLAAGERFSSHVAEAEAESLDPRLRDRRVGGQAGPRVDHPSWRFDARSQRECAGRKAFEELLRRGAAGARVRPGGEPGAVLGR